MTIKVKPLVWEDRGDYATCFPRYKSETVLGVYYIDRDKSGLFNVWSSATRGKVQVRTLEAAKAFAQADYESRILSAIEPLDPATIRAEALREAAGVANFLAEMAKTAIEQDGKDAGLRLTIDVAATIRSGILALIDKEQDR